MSYLSVENLNLSYARGPFALQNANFSCEKGEIIALLGPSGCGKTTLLNLIAGFLTPNSGTIRVAGRDVAKVPPHQRDMAMVFQSYALFPHLSVQKNVAYGLEARHVPSSEIKPRVTEALELVGLAGYRRTFPRQLSGGQQQRVALARALIVRPSILLLDEPLSNLDTLLRKTMRQEIHDILKRVGTTAVMVTHDQEEALVVADRILLMSQGQIDQIGSPREIYENPRSIFGARFMASENLFEGTVASANVQAVMVDTAIGKLACRPSADSVAAGQRVTVTVRPERITLGAIPAHGDHLNRVSGKVQSVSYIGTYERILCAVGGHELIVHAPISPVGSLNQSSVELSWLAADTRILVR